MCDRALMQRGDPDSKPDADRHSKTLLFSLLSFFKHLFVNNSSNLPLAVHEYSAAV